MNFKKLKVNKDYKILGYLPCCPTKIKARLCALGFLKGEKILIKQKSLLNEVFIVKIRGFELCVQSKILAFLSLEERND